jgi:hypothetical protein
MPFHLKKKLDFFPSQNNEVSPDDLVGRKNFAAEKYFASFQELFRSLETI